MKVLIVGDLHMREIYPYASEFDDHRLKERAEIENAIIDAAEDCDKVVLMGDVLDSRSNSAKTIKNLTAFIEAFGDKRIVIMSGNHDSFANGESALDFLGEVKDRKWDLVTRGMMIDEDQHMYIPFTRRSETGHETDQEMIEWLLDTSKSHMDPKAIFLHHCLSGTKTSWGQLTDTFREPVFPSESLSDRFQRVFGAHVHKAQDNGNQSILGAVMNHEVGEHEDKRIIKWDTEKDEIESIKLPGRKFYKIVNPTREQLDKFKGQTIEGLVKIVIDEHNDETDEILSALETQIKGPMVVHELPASDRKRVKEDIDDFSLDNLIRIYSEIKDVPMDDLKKGLALIEE